MPKVKVRGPNHVEAITKKTTEAIFTKLHGNLEHNENVCRTQEIGSYAQGHGHNQVKIVS